MHQEACTRHESMQARFLTQVDTWGCGADLRCGWPCWRTLVVKYLNETRSECPLELPIVIFPTRFRNRTTYPLVPTVQSTFLESRGRWGSFVVVHVDDVFLSILRDHQALRPRVPPIAPIVLSAVVQCTGIRLACNVNNLDVGNIASSLFCIPPCKQISLDNRDIVGAFQSNQSTLSICEPNLF